MSWERLKTTYTDAVWVGLKKYNQITNTDGTVSLQDVTLYTNKDNSFFGALDANRMNEAINTIMSMVESGTDLYEAFQTYFDTQRTLFTEKETEDYNDFLATISNLESQGEVRIQSFESTQESIFNAWFQAMRDHLSQDSAGNLQNQCTELDTRLSLLEQMVLQNDYSVPIATDDSTLTLITDELGYALLANWKNKEE